MILKVRYNWPKALGKLLIRQSYLLLNSNGIFVFLASFRRISHRFFGHPATVWQTAAGFRSAAGFKVWPATFPSGGVVGRRILRFSFEEI